MYQIRRLERLGEKCGVGKKKNNAEPEVDLSKMTKYEVAQYKIACDMQRVRTNIGQLDALGEGAPASKRSEVAQSIRRDIQNMKKALIDAQKLAKLEEKRDDYEKLAMHVKKTEALHKQRFNTVGDELLGTSPLPTGSAPVRSAAELEMKDLASPMVSLREDEEFSQFFMMTQKRDVEIDQALDRISVGVTVLRDQAVRINTELKVQDQLLQDAEKKTDKLQGDLKSLNKKVKAAIREVEKDKLCIYLVCFLLLLGLAGAIYYQISQNKK